MEEIKELVREQLSSRKITAEEELQLIKICEKEDAFVKEFSKAKATVIDEDKETEIEVIYSPEGKIFFFKGA